MTEVTFGSACSGIEAASVAWNQLGWKAVWLAEIELYPSKVLAHYYPKVPNLGNMLLIPAMLRNGDIPAPDVFAGGTPCQAFSVAGLRASLKDARGNLSMTFCEIADEIDIQRAAAGLLPCVIKWENVPGVLTTKDNAFGCFLGGLAGESEALVPEPCPAAGKSGRFWKWNKKDGQHTLSWPKCGVVLGPQRAVAWRVLDAQYFGLAQRRLRVFVVASAREGFDPAAVLLEFDGLRRDSAPSREAGEDVAGTLASRTEGGGFPGSDEACSGYVQAVVSTLDASYGRLQGCSGQDMNHGHSHLVPIAFDSRQECVSSTEVFGALGSSSPQAQAICFSGKDYGADATFDLAPTMRAMNHAESHANGGGQLAVSYAIQAGALRTNPASGPDGVGQPIVAAFDTYNQNVTGDVTQTLCSRGDSPGGNAHLVPAVQTGMAVRRLMPIECERLQGFPDNHTLIPMGKKMAADGPRYKALGNSWAIPCVYWIGARIDKQLRQAEAKAAA